MKRQIARVGVLPLLVLVTWACGGEAAPPPPGIEALEGIEEGILRSEVLERLPEGDLGEGPGRERGYRINRYLVDGETIEVLWIHRPGEAEVTEGGLRDRLTPVVFRGTLLEGWGWARFGELRERWGLPLPEDPEAG